jgi:hypothetical protein
MQDIFLPPNTPNSKVVGRFVEWTKTWTDQNGDKKERQVISLQTMVPGIAEPTSSIVPPGPVGDKIKKEYSAAWALFEKNRQRTVPEVPTATEHNIAGTPIEDASFLGKDFIARLKLMGFLTLEQLADMSDTQCQNVGFGAKDWRRKAREHLIVVRDAAVTRAADAPDVSDLQRQLAEAQAQIAALMAVVAPPAPVPAETDEGPVEAPKPRRGRPKAEAQPEA